MKNVRALGISLVMHVTGWVLQILGHLVFERRLPAFFDNILQAFLLAPLFVFMELLFLIGYRPALQKRTRERIKANIHTWKLSKEQGRHSKSD